MCGIEQNIPWGDESKGGKMAKNSGTTNKNDVIKKFSTVVGTHREMIIKWKGFSQP